MLKAEKHVLGASHCKNYVTYLNIALVCSTLIRVHIQFFRPFKTVQPSVVVQIASVVVEVVH
jgi:hypothetical protein